MAGVFKEAVLTTKGIALLAKAQAGQCTIALTRAESGCGSYEDGEDIQSQTALKETMQSFSLETVTVINDTNVCTKFIITNNPDSGTLETGYYVKEIGIFATDPDEGEILYALAIAEEDKWDYMPAYNDLLPSTITVDFMIKVANASEVTITAPNRTYLYDETTGAKYILGIDDGLLYYEEVDE